MTTLAVKLYHEYSYYTVGILRAVCSRILRLYSAGFELKRCMASAWAGDFGLGLSRRSWMPMSMALMVMAGRQPSSSLRILRQMVPEGYTLGWNKGGTNLHFGGYILIVLDLKQRKKEEKKSKKGGKRAQRIKKNRSLS